MTDRIPLPVSSLATWCRARRLPGRRNRFLASRTNDSDHAKCMEQLYHIIVLSRVVSLVIYWLVACRSCCWLVRSFSLCLTWLTGLLIFAHRLMFCWCSDKLYQRCCVWVCELRYCIFYAHVCWITVIGKICHWQNYAHGLCALVYLLTDACPLYEIELTNYTQPTHVVLEGRAHFVKHVASFQVSLVRSWQWYYYCIIIITITYSQNQQHLCNF